MSAFGCFVGFLAGYFGMMAVFRLLTPWRQRQSVREALLERAKSYNLRAQRLAMEGRYTEAKRNLAEADALLMQVRASLEKERIK